MRRLFHTGALISALTLLPALVLAQVGSLPGMAVLPHGTTPLTLTYETQSSSNPSGSSDTYTSQAIGTAAANRWVAVCAETEGAIGTISGLTIGGISATRLVTSTTGSGSGGTDEIWIAPVPTGTTATIVVSYSVTPSRGGIGVWALYGGNGTASSTATSTVTSGTSTVSVNVQAGGAVIGCAVAVGGATYTGLTKNYDASIGGTSANQSGGSLTFAASATPQTITIVRGGGGSAVDNAVSVAFAPI